MNDNGYGRGWREPKATGFWPRLKQWSREPASTWDWIRIAVGLAVIALIIEMIAMVIFST